MASAITHFIVGASVGLPWMESCELRGVMPRWAIPVTAGVFGAIPDLDTYLMFAFDIPRGTLFSHRGFFHSPFFLAIFAFAVAAFVARRRQRARLPASFAAIRQFPTDASQEAAGKSRPQRMLSRPLVHEIAFPFGLGRPWLTLGALWACAAITHPLLDMLTDGGSGVMLLFPFSQERLFFPWRPIRVSPLGIARFFQRAHGILLSELPFCAAALAVGFIAMFTRRSARS